MAKGIDTRNLIYRAMGEADIHRRYYYGRRDRLMGWNTLYLILAWALAIAGTITSILYTGNKWSLVLVLSAASITSLRDVFGLPNRIAEARAAAILTNEEFDRMRLLLETGGKFRPDTELESFVRLSRSSSFLNESIKDKTLSKAEAESKKYRENMELPQHDAIIAQTN